MNRNFRRTQACKFCSWSLYIPTGFGFGELHCNLDNGYTGPIMLHDKPYRFNECLDVEPLRAQNKRVESHTVCDDFMEFDK